MLAQRAAILESRMARDNDLKGNEGEAGSERRPARRVKRTGRPQAMKAEITADPG